MWRVQDDHPRLPRRQQTTGEAEGQRRQGQGGRRRRRRRSGSASAAEPADRNDRAKVECHLCGYKSVPQWLNDKAHCLKCQAVLKTQQTVHGSTDGKLHPTTQRQAGEVSTFKHSAGSAMESESGDCSKAPTGSHHWKFGKCEFCGKAEGILVKGPGVTANPGGVGGCDKGGKCIFKFSKCSKCARSEY
mmetsp:Transcript_32136/g.92858  ORF Transcript_32136/g.92858 Transcript_32136/m.92858 type:complete len:189 (-) Transcript_32136:310-876(-)